jgi:hypothetical protein
MTITVEEGGAGTNFKKKIQNVHKKGALMIQGSFFYSRSFDGLKNNFLHKMSSLDKQSK